MEESGSGMEGANEWLTPGAEYSEMGTFLLEGLQERCDSWAEMVLLGGRRFSDLAGVFCEGSLAKEIERVGRASFQAEWGHQTGVMRDN